MLARSRRAAHTLIEVLVVVLVLMIIAGIVIPTLLSGQDSQVCAAARIVASDLETARSMAVTTLVPHSLVFNDTLTAYKVVANYADEGFDAAVAVDHPVKAGSAYMVLLAAQGGMTGVRVTSADFGGEAFVTFDSQGEPSSPGTVSLAAGVFLMDVSVEALTGNIAVSDMTN